MVEKITIACPSCGQPAQKEGNKITCENCDAVYAITKTGSATLRDLGSIEDHENRIRKLESLLPGQEPDDPKEPDEKEPDEEDIL